MRLSRGPNTFSSSPASLEGSSGIVRVLPRGHSTTLLGADDWTTHSAMEGPIYMASTAIRG